MTYRPKPKTKTLPCRYCKRPITVGWKTKKSPAHLECSINAVMQAANQMREKSGPYYDHWRNGMARFLDRETLARPPSLENIDLPDHELQ